jgi:hypothetical protein
MAQSEGPGASQRSWHLKAGEVTKKDGQVKAFFVKNSAFRALKACEKT